MLIRGKSNFITYDINGNVKLRDGDLRVINLETIQMLQGIKDGNSYFLVAFVQTGRSNYGPINVTLTHPASNSVNTRLKEMETLENVSGDFVDNFTGYWVDTVSASKNTNKDTFYRSRDTNNIYFIRRFFMLFHRNFSKFFRAFMPNYNVDIKNKYSWRWLTGGDDSTGNISTVARNLIYNKVSNDSRYNEYIGINGIEMVKLGYYSSKENILIEINKIQREYSKYIRGTLACFEPPKVYQLGADRLSVNSIRSGDPYNESMGASFRYTTSKPYVTNNKLIADAGLYLNSSVWLRSGIDYDIDFPIIKGTPKSGTYTLTYRFKGQYISLGTKKVSFYWNGS